MASRRALAAPLGFLGAGQMALALAKGLVAAGVCQASQLWASDRDPAQLEALRQVNSPSACDDSAQRPAR
jgi:pyrroline-5-carboxylate reductase